MPHRGGVGVILYLLVCFIAAYLLAGTITPMPHRGRGELTWGAIGSDVDVADGLLMYIHIGRRRSQC